MRRCRVQAFYLVAIRLQKIADGAFWSEKGHVAWSTTLSFHNSIRHHFLFLKKKAHHRIASLDILSGSPVRFILPTCILLVFLFTLNVESLQFSLSFDCLSHYKSQTDRLGWIESSLVHGPASIDSIDR